MATSPLAEPAGRQPPESPSCRRVRLLEKLWCLSPPIPQTREQLQAEVQRAQTQIEDLEKALAEEGQVSAGCFGSWELHPSLKTLCPAES